MRCRSFSVSLFLFLHFLAEINKAQPNSVQALVGVKSIMLIRNLYSLFCGSESQNRRSDSATLDVIEKASTEVIIPEKFKEDIERLTEYGVKLRTGLCIEIELGELLEILTRERRRKDAYDKLVKFLAEEMNIQLTIKSRKR